VKSPDFSDIQEMMEFVRMVEYYGHTVYIQSSLFGFTLPITIVIAITAATIHHHHRNFL
jgi:hypothetical protein